MNFFFEFFNQNRPYLNPDSSKWPKEWSEINFKSYPRLEQIKLPKPKNDSFLLANAVKKRKSQRDFSGKPISIEELSQLLFFSAGIVRGEGDQSRRAYPSGGARYSLEIYPVIISAGDLRPGIYHYNVKRHNLEVLLKGDEEMRRFFEAFHYQFIKDAAAVFIITMVPWRSSIKYGNFAFKLGLIEAGHLGQNFYLMSAAQNLKCCALGGLNEKIIHELLDIDGVTEVAFYSIAIGK